MKNKFILLSIMIGTTTLVYKNRKKIAQEFNNYKDYLADLQYNFTAVLNSSQNVVKNTNKFMSIANKSQTTITDILTDIEKISQETQNITKDF